jgi:hypothetical protein
MLDLNAKLYLPSELLAEGIRCLNLLKTDNRYQFSDAAVHEYSFGKCLINCTGALLAINTAYGPTETIEPDALPEILAKNTITLQWTLLGHLCDIKNNRISENPVFPTATLEYGLAHFTAAMTGVAAALDMRGF